MPTGSNFDINIKYSAIKDKLTKKRKIAQIIMIQKPGKSIELAESYRPISLLSYRNYLKNFYSQSSP